MTKLKITVTQEDIEEGQARSCHRCPVALAMSRTIGRELVVYPHYAGTLGMDVVCFFPSEVEQFIADFDEGKPVKPFSFTVKASL